jgi:hypothetical protein
MSFDPVWASDENSLIDVPSDAEIRTGFVCGPASPGRFNWLFQTIQSMVNSLNIGDMASKFRQVATTEGVQGGGNLEADRTIRLDLNGLQKTTAVKSGYVLGVYDPDVNAHRGITRANFVQGLGAGTGEDGFILGGGNIGDGTGELYSGIDDGNLEFRSLKNAGGLAIVTTGDVVTFALANMGAALTID